MKLQQNGIAHYILPLAIVGIVAIGGVFALVSSHADSVTRTKTAAARVTSIVATGNSYTFAGHSSGGGGPQGQGGKWCADVTLTYRVYTDSYTNSLTSQDSGSRRVQLVLRNSSGQVSYQTVSRGANGFTANVPHGSTCVSSKGGTANTIFKSGKASVSTMISGIRIVSKDGNVLTSKQNTRNYIVKIN